jgi:hypothetical protein
MQWNPEQAHLKLQPQQQQQQQTMAQPYQANYTNNWPPSGSKNQPE